MKAYFTPLHKVFTPIIILALIFGAAPVLPAHAVPLAVNGDFVFANRFGGVGWDEANDITIDQNGNIYITGYFDGQTDFDPGAGVANLTPVGVEDVFIAKYDSNGNYIWANSMGGIDYDGGSNVVVDSNGNVYLLGYFAATVDFDSGAGVANLTSLGDYDVFVLKLDSNGDFVWVKQIGGTGNDSGGSIVLDATGNIYLTGSFSLTVDFDPNVGVFNLSSAGSYDIFVLKLDSNGSYVWAKKMGGNSGDYGYDLALDAGNNVYVTGNFLGTSDFDPGIGITNLTSAGAQDIYVLKLNSLGTFIWAKRMGGISNDFGSSIALDSNGNVYTVGSFRDTTDFDPGVGIMNLTPAGDYDIFVSKLDNNGNFNWVRAMGSTGSDGGNSIVIDSNDNIYVTGGFSLTVDFNPGVGVANLTSAGQQDIFVARLSSLGTFVWAKSMGGIDYDTSTEIALGPNGNVYTTGYFADIADFDPGAGSLDLISAGVFDIFISKLENNINSSTFVDVPTTYWAWEYIERLYSAGITGGCTTAPLNYCPEAQVTRAQMAVFLEKGLYYPSLFNAPDAAPTFIDTVGHWAEDWIEALKSDGVTAGCAADLYCPDNPVTRAQMAVFLLKSKYGSSYTPPVVGASTGFTDVPTTHWAAAWIKQLAAEGITGGCGSGIYCPDNPVTRAQMAVFLVKTFSLP